MKKGVLLFAYNNEECDYYTMAVATARRINHFLDLPVSIVTTKDYAYPDPAIDQLIFQAPDNSNKKDGLLWNNTGRFNAWTLTPYDETIVLDADYVVNSRKLLKVFDFYDDFCCHDKTSFLMIPDAEQEYLSKLSLRSVWATVMYFKKTKRSRHIFQCMRMIQNNFQHYANIHNFVSATYRNDYSLTLALRIVNGHTDNKQDFIPWNLVHVGKSTRVIHHENFDRVKNTEFLINYDNWKNNKIKKEYMIVKDMDFHMLNKENFIGLFKNHE